MSSMEFWGVEVKAGETLKVEPGLAMVIHLSQACFGEIKKDKGNEYVRLYAKKEGQKFVIGCLSLEKSPFINFDLVFEDDFELVHDWKHGSVHFAGYRVSNPAASSEEEEEESDDDIGEPIPTNVLDNGKPAAKQSKATAANAAAKPDTARTKLKVKIVEPNKDAKQDEEDDDDDDEDDSDELEDAINGEDGSDEDDDSDEEDDDDSDEETPKKAEPISKKRPAESGSKTAASSDKKAKMVTPEKTDGKKRNVHVATPHPSKHALKAAANSGKPNPQIQKPDGTFTCSSCSRSFGSDQALQSHSKAKHGK